LHN
jgi:hypothetical protein